MRVDDSDNVDCVNDANTFFEALSKGVLRTTPPNFRRVFRTGLHSNLMNGIMRRNWDPNQPLYSPVEYLEVCRMHNTPVPTADYFMHMNIMAAMCVDYFNPVLIAYREGLVDEECWRLALSQQAMLAPTVGYVIPDTIYDIKNIEEIVVSRRNIIDQVIVKEVPKFFCKGSGWTCVIDGFAMYVDMVVNVMSYLWRIADIEPLPYDESGMKIYQTIKG